VTRAAVNLLLEARVDQFEISDMDSWGCPRFGHTEKLETHKSPPAVTFFELNPKPAPVPTIKIAIDLSDVDWDGGEEGVEILRRLRFFGQRDKLNAATAITQGAIRVIIALP
jgi:hypothetical protein